MTPKEPRTTASRELVRLIHRLLPTDINDPGHLDAISRVMAALGDVEAEAVGFADAVVAAARQMRGEGSGEQLEALWAALRALDGTEGQ